MKITKLSLRSYLHFEKNTQIHFTYPKGHASEGEPLQKVCFLGQSATGKTSLLNLIRRFVCEGRKVEHSSTDEKTLTTNGVELHYKVDGHLYSRVSAGDGQFEDYTYEHEGKRAKVEAQNREQFNSLLQYGLRQTAPLLISFPFPIGWTDLNGARAFETHDAQKGQLEVASRENLDVWDLNPRNIGGVWKIVFEKVENYRKQYNQKMTEHFKRVAADPDKAGEITAEFREWEKANPNPLQELVDKCLLPFFKHFHLKVETDLDKYPTSWVPGQNDMWVIIRREEDGCEIPNAFVSTGTKQLILTAMPLFYLKPRNTVILFDQPETSLFPNIQECIPDLYMDACGERNNQFFFATHSPIVASAFEPWEVIELDFNENGNVYIKDYCGGKERHVDNYLIDPGLLNWNSSYRLLFGVTTEGREEERTKALMDLGKLEADVKQEKDVGKKRELFEKYSALAKKLDWDFSSNEAPK